MREGHQFAEYTEVLPVLEIAPVYRGVDYRKGAAFTMPL
jgi:hypothetical protein